MLQKNNKWQSYNWILRPNFLITFIKDDTPHLDKIATKQVCKPCIYKKIMVSDDLTDDSMAVAGKTQVMNSVTTTKNVRSCNVSIMGTLAMS